MGISGKFFSFGFGLGPFRFGVSSGGGGGGDPEPFDPDNVRIFVTGLGTFFVVSGFGWFIGQTIGGFNFIAYIICPAVIWAGGAFISWVMQDILGDFSMRRKTSFFERVIPLAISLLSPWTFVIAMRNIPLMDRNLWNLSGPEKQKLYGTSLAGNAPFMTWLMVIIGGYLLVLLVVCLKELLLSFIKLLNQRRRQRKNDKSLLILHRETVMEHGFNSVSELTSYLAKSRNEEYRQWLERTNREAKEVRKSENLKNYVNKVRGAQLRASKKESKEIFDLILDDLHGKVKLKLNPDVGETITQEEMVEAFQHAGRQVNATTKLTDEHRKAVWEQIGKLAQILLNEADWDVSTPTPIGD